MSSWHKKTPQEKTEELEDELAQVKAEIRRLMAEDAVEKVPSASITSSENGMEICDASTNNEVTKYFVSLNDGGNNSKGYSSNAKSDSKKSFVRQKILKCPITGKYFKTYFASNKLGIASKSDNSDSTTISCRNQNGESSSNVVQANMALPRDEFNGRCIFPHRESASYLKSQQNVVLQNTVSKSNSENGIVQTGITKKSALPFQYSQMQNLPEELVDGDFEAMINKTIIDKNCPPLCQRGRSDIMNNKLQTSESFGGDGNNFSVERSLKEDSGVSCTHPYTENCKSFQTMKIGQNSLTGKIRSKKMQQNCQRSKQKIPQSLNRALAIVATPGVKRLNVKSSKRNMSLKSKKLRDNRIFLLVKSDYFNKVISKYPSPSLNTSVELKKLLASVSVFQGSSDE